MPIENKKYDDSVKKPEQIKMSETSKGEVIETTKKELSKEKYFRSLEKRFGDIFNNINFLSKNKTSTNIFLLAMDKVAKAGKNETPQEMYDRMIKEEQEKLKVLLIELQNYKSKNENNLNDLEKEFLERLEFRVNRFSNESFDLTLYHAFKNIYKKDNGYVIVYNDERLREGVNFSEFDYHKHQSLYKEHIHTGKTEEELEKIAEEKRLKEENEKREKEYEKRKKEEAERLKLESINLNIKSFSENGESNTENIDFKFSKSEESINNLKKLGLNDKEIRNVFENYSSFLKKISDLGILGYGSGNHGEMGYQYLSMKPKNSLDEFHFGDVFDYVVYEGDFKDYNVSVLKIIANSKNKTGKQLEYELEKLFVKEKYDKKVLEKVDYYLKKGENSDYTVKLEGNKLYVYIRYGNYNNVSGHFTIPRTEIKTGKLLNGENMKFFGPDSDKHFDEFVAKIRKKGDSLYGEK